MPINIYSTFYGASRDYYYYYYYYYYIMKLLTIN